MARGWARAVPLITLCAIVGDMHVKPTGDDVVILVVAVIAIAALVMAVTRAYLSSAPEAAPAHESA